MVKLIDEGAALVLSDISSERLEGFAAKLREQTGATVFSLRANVTDEEACDAVGPDAGSFYDAVYATVRQRKKFIVQPSEVREMMRVIDSCRKQNPAFPGR